MVSRRTPTPALRPRQRGAVVVELAIVGVIVLLVMAGIVSFGRAFWYADALGKSVRDGARLLSQWPADTLVSNPDPNKLGGLAAARELTRAGADAANVTPRLTDANVRVQCLDGSFAEVACANGVTPANVRVSITGFAVNLGQWFPFLGSDFGSVNLVPQSTMRYMN